MTVHEDLLVADFNQCFEHMRHYDESFRRTLEFSFGGLASVVVASAALLGRYGTTVITTELVGILLLISSFSSLVLVILMARNRVYFALVARFVNEIRSLYLARSPGDIMNKSKMYNDYRFPRIFSPGSSQSFQLYFLSACNSFLFAGAIALFHASFDLYRLKPAALHWITAVLGVLVFLSCELLWVLTYWRSKQKKRTANSTVFGR